jgi:hypothetical protein
MLIAAGNNYIESDSNDKLTFNTKTERLYSSIDKINKLLSVVNGNCLYGNGGIDVPGSYGNLFTNDRAAFITTELKGSLALRNMKSDYGIIPMPKLNEIQGNYITYTSENVCRLVIPKTNDYLARTGTILDMLSFECYKNVLPLYFNQTISQKGLRDADSIEMLSFINENRMTDMGMIFGITNNLVNEIQNMIIKGENNASSIMSANQETINQKLQNIINTFNI